jgi:heptosyltransferase I
MIDGPATPLGRICLIRLSSIGDVCHTVSVVQSIQRYDPHCRLTWVIGHTEAGLVGDLPGVEFVVCDKTRGLAGIMDLRRTLKRRRFDRLLHMQVSLRASLVSLMVHAPVRIGFDRSRASEGQWLFTNRRIPPQRHPHVLEGLAAFAAALGVPDQAPAWHIPVPAADRDWAEHVLPAGPPVLAIVPGASRRERNWTAEGYAAVADYAMKRGFRVALFGGRSGEEYRLGDAIRERLDQPVSNLIGRTTLKQLLALLCRTSLLLAPDTGPVHMAVTQGVPVIGLYCHSNPRRTGPYTCQDYVVNHYDSLVEARYGAPWESRPWGARLKGADLMQDIRPEEVISMFDKVVGERGLAR